MIFIFVFTGLLSTIAIADEAAERSPSELGKIAATAALCGETKLYLTLQERYQLDTEYEQGKREGMKTFPTGDVCKALKTHDLFAQTEVD